MYWRTIPEEKRKWWILAAMTTSVSMTFIDITILPVALPSISRDLIASNLELQWIINAYTLALTVFVLSGGRLSDRWGLRRGFCIGLLLFALASALCGVCKTAQWIIFSRALQGIGGALMIPSAQGILLGSFPPHQRGMAVGTFVSVGSVFLTLGPLIGGSLTQYLNWRYVFWINLPIAAIGFVLTQLVVPPFAKGRQSFDILGFLTLGFGVSSFVIALMNAQLWGWSSPLTLCLFALGIFLITLLIRSERKIAHPILDVDMIKKKTFFAGSIAIFFAQFLAMVTVFWAIFFQDVLNYSPSMAGFVVFISNAPVLITAPFAGMLVDRLGPRIPVLMGFSLITFSLIWFVFFYKGPQITHLLPGLLPYGFGMPLIFTPSFVSMMNDISAEKRGAASGTNATIRQFGATIGLAIFGSFFHACYHFKFAKALQANSFTNHLETSQFEGLLSHTPSSLLAIKELPAQVGSYVSEHLTDAYVFAFHAINLLAASCAIVGIFVAIKWLRNKPFVNTQ